MKIRLLILCLAALLLSACQIDARVDVTVDDTGGGLVAIEVLFDEAVIEHAPELVQDLNVADLIAAGWSIEGPSVTAEGGAAVSASKAFASPEQLGAVLGEIAGPNTIFEDFTVKRERSFARTTYIVTGRVNPTESLTVFGDEGISELLGDPLGLSLADYEALAGRPLSEALALDFSVTLPDNAVATSGIVRERTASWNLSPADPLPTNIYVEAGVEDQLPRIWAAIALVALALLATMLLFSLLAIFGGRRTARAGKASSVQMRRPDKPSKSAPEQPAEPAQRRLELVVLDARSVLYDEANDIGGRLLPYLRAHGSEASLTQVNQAWVAASLGRLSTAELWRVLGVRGPGNEIDAHYTSNYKLREGVIEFIDQLHLRGLRVAVITNNPLGWSRALQRRFGLAEKVDTWVISGEVGSRMPERAFFEAIRRMTGVQFQNMVLIDDQAIDLDRAKSLGMSTAMFVPLDSTVPEASGHPMLHGLDSFFKGRMQR